MNILYIGDIMGESGMQTVKEVLPGLKKEQQIDLVIAQAENVTDGKGLSKDSASVIILFAQKAKYCGRYQLKSVWLFVHFVKTE